MQAWPWGRTMGAEAGAAACGGSINRIMSRSEGRRFEGRSASLGVGHAQEQAQAHENTHGCMRLEQKQQREHGWRASKSERKVMRADLMLIMRFIKLPLVPLVRFLLMTTSDVFLILEN